MIDGLGTYLDLLFAQTIVECESSPTASVLECPLEDCGGRGNSHLMQCQNIYTIYTIMSVTSPLCRRKNKITSEGDGG